MLEVMSHTGGVVNCDETTWDSDRGEIVLKNKRRTEVTVTLGDVVGATWMPPEGHSVGDEREKEGKEVALVEQGAFQTSDHVVVAGAGSAEYGPCLSIQVWTVKAVEKYDVVAEERERGRSRCQEFAKNAAERVRQDESGEEGRRRTNVMGRHSGTILRSFFRGIRLSWKIRNKDEDRCVKGEMWPKGGWSRREAKLSSTSCDATAEDQEIGNGLERSRRTIGKHRSRREKTTSGLSKWEGACRARGCDVGLDREGPGSKKLNLGLDQD